MDAYFASVEQKCNPAIRGKPVIVTGKGTRTVIATSSYEARKYGIKTGMTVFDAERLCPYVIRIVGDPRKYLHTTLRIREALMHFTNQVELYSIDEFFLDITESQSIFGRAEEMLGMIKDKVRETTGLSCSCGLAPNKLLAKLGSGMKKPNGLTVIHPENVADILEDLPVGELHGIGSKTRKYLGYLGISKAGELAKASLNLLISHFGFYGYMLKRMGQGIDNSRVSYYWEQDEVKSVGNSYTLPSDTIDPAVVNSHILMLCQKVALRLRKERKAARTVVLTIRYDDFRTSSYRKSVGYFVDTINGVYHVCMRILQDIVGELTRPVRLLGVSVTNFVERSRQPYLFEELAKEEKLNKAIQEINDRFGEFTIKPASLLLLDKPRAFPGIRITGNNYHSTHETEIRNGYTAYA